MRRATIIIALMCICGLLCAQEPSQMQSKQDTVEVNDFFSTLPESLTVNQSVAVRSAMRTHMERNAKRAAAGYLTQQTYRIRIFFDNGQDARNASEVAVAKFKAGHPGVPVSRTFTNPYFKVTVGNYASKADAQAALKTLQAEFPSAFIVRDSSK